MPTEHALSGNASYSRAVAATAAAGAAAAEAVVALLLAAVGHSLARPAD